MSSRKLRQHTFSDKQLETLQRVTFDYFLKETNPQNGLVPDSTRQGSACSITPTGFALAAYPVGVERGFITRRDAIKRTLTTMRFFWNSPHGPEPDATGYKGFYYHFLDMKTGRRTWNCELSTIDSTFLISGALTAAQYFKRDTEDEREFARLPTPSTAGPTGMGAEPRMTVTHGWRPKAASSISLVRVQRSAILYVLALASPTHPLPARELPGMDRTYNGRALRPRVSYGGPLFLHQLSHMWIDFRGIQDDYMRKHESDYFENSRRATYIQQQYVSQSARLQRLW